MTEEKFLTIAKNAQYEEVIKKSRFICSVFRIKDENSAKKYIDKVSNDNKKANHNCFAYMVGDDDHIQRESDNGEPSGTAGVPILESLQMANIHNVCAVVTRYFGGIKLGAGGLIRAYSNVTTSAIHAAGLVQRVEQTCLKVVSPYKLHDSVTYFLREQGITIDHEEFGAKVDVYILVNNDKVEELSSKLTNHFNKQLLLSEVGHQFNEIPFVK